MDQKFIYVYKKEDRDKLLKYGYVMLKADEENEIYCFKNLEDTTIKFDFSVLYSNVLTF